MMAKQRKIFLSWRFYLSYCGLPFKGWQKQSNTVTIQKELEMAFFFVLGTKVLFVVAGRTDSGVHARGQVFSCTFKSHHNTVTILLALKTVLPKYITIWRADCTIFGFNARRHAIGKTYCYTIEHSSIERQIYSPVKWICKKKLNIFLMKKIAQYLVGEHNFDAFCSIKCQTFHGRRLLWAIKIKKCKKIVNINISGNAFCYNMVRIMIDTIVNIGLKNIAINYMSNDIACHNCTFIGKAVPACGLALSEIYYADTQSNKFIVLTEKYPGYPLI